MKMDPALAEEMEDIGPPVLEEIEEEVVDELSREFVEDLIDKIVQFLEVLCGHPLHAYQIPLARRIIESVLIGDGEEVVAEASRQSGKTEAVADVVAALLVILPILAKRYPTLLSKFTEGFWVGMFAPVEGQVETMFTRAVTRLTSERAKEILTDDEIGEDTKRAGTSVKTLRLTRSGSFVSMMTANPRAKIESKTFHLIVIDECFPYDTHVLTSEGWVEIGDIVTGSKRDWIVATQDGDGLGWARVRTAYRTPRHTPLVRVDHLYGTVYATANHPFMVDGEAVPAISLQTGAPLSVVPGTPQPESDGARTTGGAGVLLQQMQSAVEESYGGGVSALVHVGHPPQDRASSQGPGRERSWIDDSAADALGLIAQQLDRRVCVPYWSEDQGRSSNPLQDRPGEPRADGGSGIRRRIPRLSAEAGGPAQGSVVVESRVVSVQVLEPGSPEFDQFGDRADYVYTLEVDSNSHTYVADGVLVGNCQDTDDMVVEKSISPMLAYYSGTLVKTGTPSTTKNNFYRSIQYHRRRQTMKAGAKRNYFRWDWKDVAKVNKDYEQYVRKKMLQIGEDSDEFQMSYAVRWILERGMFTTQKMMDELSDSSMNYVKSWTKTPVVVGIDPARAVDSTAVMVCWVDWDRPDEYGFYDHRVLNWLEMQGDDWEEQYAQIVDFLSSYNVASVAVDGTGLGDVVAQRLDILLPRARVTPLQSNLQEQSKRWKHLMALMDRRMVGWPGHPNAKRTKQWQRFQQQMLDAEKQYKAGHLLVAAPNEKWAHDDLVDALALACYLTADAALPTVEVSSSPFWD